MKRRQNIITIKRQLYGALLDLPYNLWTDADANLGVFLAEDPDIQELLEHAKNCGDCPRRCGGITNEM